MPQPLNDIDVEIADVMFPVGEKAWVDTAGEVAGNEMFVDGSPRYPVATYEDAKAIAAGGMRVEDLAFGDTFTLQDLSKCGIIYWHNAAYRLAWKSNTIVSRKQYWAHKLFGGDIRQIRGTKIVFPVDVSFSARKL